MLVKKLSLIGNGQYFFPTIIQEPRVREPHKPGATLEDELALQRYQRIPFFPQDDAPLHVVIIESSRISFLYSFRSILQHRPDAVILGFHICDATDSAKDM